jgi:hypothetical protein
VTPSLIWPQRRSFWAACQILACKICGELKFLKFKIHEQARACHQTGRQARAGSRPGPVTSLRRVARPGPEAGPGLAADRVAGLRWLQDSDDHHLSHESRARRRATVTATDSEHATRAIMMRLASVPDS